MKSHEGDGEESDAESEYSTGQCKHLTSSPLLPFLGGHPLADSHGSCCQFVKKTCIPDFVGPTLPRFDQGDQEYYCCTMLTPFKPWRSGLDLKRREESWDDAFSRYPFTERQLELMRYMNIRYECYDAQNDFHALMKVGASLVPGWDKSSAQIMQDITQLYIENSINIPFAKPLDDNVDWKM